MQRKLRGRIAEDVNEYPHTHMRHGFNPQIAGAACHQGDPAFAVALPDSPYPATGSLQAAIAGQTVGRPTKPLYHTSTRPPARQ